MGKKENTTFYILEFIYKIIVQNEMWVNKDNTMRGNQKKNSHSVSRSGVSFINHTYT